MLSTRRRSFASFFISSVKNLKVLSPSPFAWSRAVSEFFSSWCGFSASEGKMEMPMLTETRSSWCLTCMGSCMALMIFFATEDGMLSEVTPVSTRANSSSPMRAAVSLPLAQSFMRLAASLSISSPAACPIMSLMLLKRSRSTISTAAICLSAAAFPMALRRRSLNRARFGRWVRGS